MTLFGAEGEPVNWLGLLAFAIILLFGLSNFAVAVSVWLQQYRKRELVLRMENAAVRLEAVVSRLTAEADSASVDRKLAQKLLSIVSGWAVVVEQQDERKVEHLKQVAMTAAKTAQEVKDAVAAATNQVMQRIDEKVTGNQSGDSTDSVKVVKPRE